MKLIDTTTLELHEFFESQVPKYAILSHRWEKGEVTFKDVKKKRNLDAPGWVKVRKCCEFVRERGYGFVWIDTCCIDKSSSAELSEAINSMYRWYNKAAICYAYLADVDCPDVNGSDAAATTNEQTVEKLPMDVERAFRASEWFTRGWTLQELLAPDFLHFVDKDWKTILGTKRELSLVISAVTGIDQGSVSAFFLSHLHSVAEMMSWASRRVCTRHEDLAYCLMGLFGVNMPLLYGEGGPAAFRRLQLQILEDSDDESIFAWHRLRQSERPRLESLLASSPADFERSANVRKFSRFSRWPRSQPYYRTNRGLALETVLSQISISKSNMLHLPAKRFIVPLRCYVDDISREPTPMAITVGCTDDPKYVKMSQQDSHLLCPEELLDRKRERFVGTTQQIFLRIN